jgi:hypothetical protein
MEACRLSQGFGSNARGKNGEHYFLKSNVHVTNHKLCFATCVKIVL